MRKTSNAQVLLHSKRKYVIVAKIKDILQVTKFKQTTMRQKANWTEWMERVISQRRGGKLGTAVESLHIDFLLTNECLKLVVFLEKSSLFTFPCFVCLVGIIIPYVLLLKRTH